MAAKKKATTKRKTATKRKVAAKKKSTSKRKPTTKSASKKTKSSKSKSGKKAFGGYAISFAGRKETVEQVFGKKPIAPSEMTKKIWAFVKAKSLSNR
ncbi:hypothetical protein NsoK4_00205 [Nitrosopumilus sp. K4]|uniref:hypothetical protein n=1 Tax=Nitrosopumilus sp. K4 TaxID=2795383 RepID=UPI001BA66464|nr:hypothetical protein [Nitrosopumilus sp. K4]QUC64754.1 hypothetical protein NsoK4_00205 [Nitrosopumilus sp. K4]